MLKILHTSDWHLGKMIFGRSLIDDQKHFIDHIFFPAIEQEQPDAVIIAGDIFDRQIAPSSAIKLFDGVITKLCREMHIPLICITGNHDGADRLSFGTGLMREMGFFLTTSANPDVEPIVIEKGGTAAHIYPLPYFDPPVARDILGQDDIKSFHDAYREMLLKTVAKLDKSACNLLTAHCFAAGSATCESEGSIYIGGSSEVDPSLFEPFDYVALGHLHSPQSAGRTARYSGSPLKYSFDEQKHQKSLTVLEIENGKIDRRALPIQPLHDMRTVSGTFEEIKDAAKSDTAREDYLFVNLRGTPIYEPMMQLREFYPNVLGLTNGSFGDSAENADRNLLRSGLQQSNNDIAVFEAFLSQMCSESMTDTDRSVFLEACERLEKEAMQ